MIEYFKELSEEELIELEKFVYSPYFTTQKNIVRLFEYLKKIYPDISNDDFSKKNISLNIYREAKVNDIKIRKLLSEFSLFMEKFFIQREVEEDEIRNRLLLLRSLRKRGFKKRYKTNYRMTLKSLDKLFSKDEEYYINRINLIDELINYKFGDIREEFDKVKQDKSDTLDFYFSFAKLHTFNEMYRSGELNNKNNHYIKKYYPEILNFVEENIEVIYKKHPNLYIIYCVIKMFENMDDRYLKQLIKYLDLKGRRFKKNKLSYYYHYISQYYIQKINMGQIQYRPKVFEIYRIMKQENLFLKDNTLSHLEYNNVCNISLALKKFDWNEEFIEEYRKYLDPVFAKDAYNLAKAKLHFYKKDYDNIFQYLNNVDFKDPTFYSHSKFLLGRIYFDMKNITGAKYIVDNLKQYIRISKSLIPEELSSIKVFIHFLNELVKVYECNVSERKSMKVILKKELDNEKRLVPNKDWFYESIEKM